MPLTLLTQNMNKVDQIFSKFLQSFKVLFRSWWNALRWSHFTARGSDTLLRSTSAWHFTRNWEVAADCSRAQWLLGGVEWGGWLCKYRHISFLLSQMVKEMWSELILMFILKLLTDVNTYCSYFKDLSCSQTWTSVFPGQNIHPCATEGAVSVSFSAVQNLLELFFSRLLSFHSHLWHENMLLSFVFPLYFFM